MLRVEWDILATSSRARSGSGVETEGGMEAEDEMGGVWFAEMADEASGRTSCSLLSCILKPES